MLAGIATVSYAIAALAFLLLSLLLLTSWRGRVHGMTLLLASTLTALWAAAAAYHAATELPQTLWLHLLELLRSIAWCGFLFMLVMPAHRAKKTAAPARNKFLYLAAGAALLIAFALVWQPAILLVLLALLVGPVGRVALAVLGMLLVEQLLRNTPSEQRWGIKFACLGIGGLFAYDFYLYSDAMLFRQINPEIWSARGLVNALAVPLVAISAARNPHWSLGIAVSRRVLFNSVALFGAAIYLLTMAAAGYYLRYVGGSWGTVMQVAFLCGALILLIAVLFSGAFRAWLKVFISKHFYSYNYDYREEWIRFTRTLSKHGPGLGERTIQAVADLVESPGGALYIARESGQCEAAAHWNMPVVDAAEPVEGDFCRFMESREWVVDLREHRANPDKYPELALPNWLRDFPKAWLVVPLVLQQKLFGFMVLAEPRSAIKLNWEVLDLLKIAGSQAASYLAQQESANALMVARQFESFNRFSTFMVHDLKNLVFQQSLLLSNAEKHKDNPAFQKDMLETVDHSVQKMKLLLQKLSRGVATETPAPLSLEQLLQQAVAGKSTAEPKPALEIRDGGLTVFANSARLERVLGHLIQNAVEATPKDGKVSVSLARQNDAAVVEITDTGHGMSEEFMRERLFKPFESTKVAGMGIGVFESREYIAELGGKLEVASRESAGTTFQVILPLLTEDERRADMAA